MEGCEQALGDMILSGTNSEYFIRTLARNLQSLNRKSTPRQPLRIQAVLWIIGTVHSVDDLFCNYHVVFSQTIVEGPSPGKQSCWVCPGQKMADLSADAFFKTEAC